MKHSQIAAWIAIVACCSLSGCRKGSQDTKAGTSAQTENKGASDKVTLTAQALREQKITVTPVELGVAKMPRRAKGRIALPDNATWRVGVLTEGRIEKVYFNLGDFVRTGQVLARMHSHDVHEARAAYANATAERSRLQAAEALAEKNYERSRRLYALKAESVSQTETAKQDLVNAQAAVSEADNDVRREQAHLVEILGVRTEITPTDTAADGDLMPIKAPASGRILEKNVTPGATISPSTDAFVIGDLSRLWMLASVDAATLANLHLRQTATVTIPDVPGATYFGKITNLGQEFDPTTRLIQVRIEIRHPDARLRPEMLANAEFYTPIGTPTLQIPQEAIQQVNGQDVVFVRITSDRFRVQPVELGDVIQNKVRVVQGLKAGDQVITRGSFSAKGQLLKSTIGE